VDPTEASWVVELLNSLKGQVREPVRTAIREFGREMGLLRVRE
jgi:hypothetical protein